MGCLPLERTTNFMGGRECVESYNIVAMSFNDKLKGLVEELNKELPGATVVLSNPYPIVMQIIQKPSSYGKFSLSCFLLHCHIVATDLDLYICRSRNRNST